MEFHVSLEGRKDLSGEIYRQLRRAILDGRLRPGDLLAPTREMARSLGVSRATVSVAYERLWSEGLVTSRAGAGTFVSEDVQGAGWGTREPGEGGVLHPREGWPNVPSPSVFGQPAEFDFRTGLPDASFFPFETWRRLVADQFRPEAVGRGTYGQPAGHAGLRAAIARHVGVSRGIQASPEDIVITNGTQQAIDLIARVLLAPGDTVAVEDPGYPPPRLLLQSLGMSVRGVPVDGEGLDVARLADGARLVYATPSHEWPLGVSMSLSRRFALLDWARTTDAAIIEDDYDSEFRYGGRPLEPLKNIDADGRVLYVGTFSKTLLPTLRLGFIIAPPSLRDALRGAKFVSDWHSPWPEQAALASFIESGGFARHLRRMRTVYERRYHLIRDVVAKDFAGVLEVVPSGAGLHVTAIARAVSPEEIRNVARRAEERGVAVQALDTYAFEVEAPAGLMLGFGSIATDRIEQGLAILRRCFEV